MAKPLKKTQYDHEWDSYQPNTEDVTGVRSPASIVRNFFFRLFGPRKHNRRDMNFAHPVKLRVKVGNKVFEPIVEDLATGGMGFRCRSSEFSSFKEGECMDFELALDGIKYETLRAEIRYTLELATGGFIGVKFTEISSDLMKRIKKETRTKDDF